MSSDVGTRAAAELGLPSTATADDADSAFLASLPSAEFVPSGNRVSALNILARRTLPGCADVESGLGFADEIEDFARNYWSLSPTERLATWTALGDRSPNEQTTGRLLDLQTGLDVSSAPRTDPIEEEIAALVRSLFLLPARRRAIRRNEWLLANASRYPILTKAASDLGTNYPALAALDPVLFAQLSTGFSLEAFAAAAIAEPVAPSEYVMPSPMSTGPFSFESGSRVAGQTAHRSETDTDRQAAPSSPWPVPPWVLVAGVMVAIRLVAAVVPSTSSSVPATPSPQRFPAAPTYSAPRLVFTNTEVDSFKSYDPASGKPAPPHYTEWVRLGRPEAFKYPTIGKTTRTPDSTSPGGRNP